MSAFGGKADITFDRAEWSFDSDPRTSGVGDIPNCLSVPCYFAIQVAGQGMGHRQSLLEYDLVLALAASVRCCLSSPRQSFRLDLFQLSQ
jgi:hypothetical protein